MRVSHLISLKEGFTFFGAGFILRLVFVGAGVLVGIIYVGLYVSISRKQTHVPTVTTLSLGVTSLPYGVDCIPITETFLVARDEQCEWAKVRFDLLGDIIPPKP